MNWMESEKHRKIKIRTWKANDDDGSKSYLGVVKVATVIAKFPRLVLLELPGGTKETVTWLELLLEKKNSKRGAKA